MTKLTRTFTAAMVADVQRVTGYAAKSGELAAALAPYAAICERWQKEGRAMKRLTKALRALIESESQAVTPAAVIREKHMHADPLPFPARVNGTDLGKAASNGQGKAPSWHPESR